MATILCKNVNYSVETPNGPAILLQNINLQIKSGEMVAVMGPSGSGKSTLLDVLSGRRQYGTVEGTVLVNNRKPDTHTRHNTAYILQDDFHIACLTVKETLTYAVRLRCHLEPESKEEADRVSTLIAMLGLTVCQNVVVGNQLIKGISGGQLRRLSIGVEVVLLPDLVCLDEPTSGLDSSTALEIVNVIKGFTLGASSAQTISTVLCTIHQPSPAQFIQFTRVVLLTPGGYLLFYGTTLEAVNFFTSTLKFDFDPSENPAEFFLEIAVGKRNPRGMEGPYELDVIVGAYNKRREKDPFIMTQAAPAVEPKEKPDTFWKIIRTLIHREWRATIFNRPYLMAQLEAQFLSALIVGIVFFQQVIAAQDKDTINKQGDISDDCYNTLGALFLGLTLATRPNIAAIPEIFVSKVLYQRESETGSYNSFEYSISIVVGRIPLLLLKTFLFCTISFFLVGYTLKFEVYLLFWFLTTLVSWVSLSYAMWLAAFCSTPMVALGLYPPAFSILSFFSGYQIHFSDLPIWFRHWMPWFSYVRFAYEGLVKNEFGNYDDHVKVYEEYDFHEDGVSPETACLALIFWIIFMTILFYFALKPSKTQLKWEISPETNETTSPMQGAPSFSGRISHQPLQTALLDGSGHIQSASFRDSSLFRGIARASGTQDIDRVRRSNVLATLHTTSAVLVNDITRLTLTELPSTEVVEYNDPLILTRDSISKKSSQMSSSTSIRSISRDPSDLQLNFDIQSLDVMLTNESGNLAPKSLLKSVKGSVNARETVAIMGPSGAGKTTLLDVLSGRLFGTTSTDLSKGDFKLKGSINIITAAVNKYPNAESCIGYVTQQSNLNAYLTVKDTMLFASEMRMPIGTPKTTRENRVTQLLEMLQLSHVADCYVGGVGATVRGVTRGQRKRLGIAIEIINLPEIIFLDEPTTGLDALLAYDVITCACDLAQTNRIVLSTIHLPSVDIFNLFSRLILLSDGYVIYNGPAKAAQNYFTTLGFIPVSIVDGVAVNPADFVIDVASHQSETKNEKKMTALDLSQSVPSGRTFQANGQRLELVLERDTHDLRANNDIDFRMTGILVRRYWLGVWNEGREIRSSIDRHVITGLIHGLVFWQLRGDDTLARSSLLYFNTMFLVMNNEQSIPRIFEAKPLRMLEISSKLYTSSTYWFSLVTATTPLTLIYSFLFIALVYPMAGLRWGAEYFFFNYVISAFGSLSGLYLCQYLAASYPTPPLAISKYTTLAAFLMGFSGYLVRLPTLPSYLFYWAPFISFFRWSYQPIFLNEFSDDEEVVEDYGFKTEDKWESFAIQILFMVFFLVATWYAFKRG